MPAKTEDDDPIKDCFYARWFTGEERRQLKQSSPDGQDEVTNLRTFAGRLTRHLSQIQPADYSNDDLKLLTSLVRISVGIGALLRGNFTINGKVGGVEKSIQAAIENMEQDWSQA
jgi:hypothetical protein